MKLSKCQSSVMFCEGQLGEGEVHQIRGMGGAAVEARHKVDRDDRQYYHPAALVQQQASQPMSNFRPALD